MDQSRANDCKLTFTRSNGRFPGVSYHFSKDKLEQHLQNMKIHSLSKKIQKKRGRNGNDIRLNHGGKRLPQKLTDQQRIEAIYLNQIHKVSLRQISSAIDSSFGAVRNTIEFYKKTGETQASDKKYLE